MTEPTRKIARQATSVVAHVAPEPDADDPLLSFAPFLHKAPRRNSITPELQRRFVATLAATGIVKVAAKRIGKSLEALYKLRARPGAEGFAAAWDAALAVGALQAGGPGSGTLVPLNQGAAASIVLGLDGAQTWEIAPQ